MKPHRRGAWFAAGVVVTLVAGSVTWAGAHGGDTSKVHGCVIQNSGYVRVVGPDDTCRKGETAVDWSAQALAPTRMLSEAFGSATAGPCGTAAAGSIPLTLTRPTTLYASASGSLRRDEGTSDAAGTLRIFLVDLAQVDEQEEEDGVVAQLVGHSAESVVLGDPNETIPLSAAGVLRGGNAAFVAPPGNYELQLVMTVSGACVLGGGTGTHDLVFSHLDVIATPTS